MSKASKKPKVKLSGNDSNIFNLISIAAKALRDIGQRNLANQMSKEITTTTKNYSEALQIIQKYIDAE